MPLQQSIASSMIKGLLIGIGMLWPLWLFIGLIIIGRLVHSIYEKQRLVKSGIADIDQMSGKVFEKYLEALFEKLGYKVERTRYVGDFGADLVTKKNGVKIVIQAKRFKGKVGVKAIQEAVAAKGFYNCDQAMVVTNSFYTKPAIELAKANSVGLWDRDKLVTELLSIKKSSSGTDGNFAMADRERIAATSEQPVSNQPHQ